MEEKAIDNSRDAGRTGGKEQAADAGRPITISGGRGLRCKMQRDTRLCVGNPQNALSQVGKPQNWISCGN